MCARSSVILNSIADVAATADVACSALASGLGLGGSNHIRYNIKLLYLDMQCIVCITSLTLL